MVERRRGEHSPPEGERKKIKEKLDPRNEADFETPDEESEAGAILDKGTKRRGKWAQLIKGFRIGKKREAAAKARVEKPVSVKEAPPEVAAVVAAPEPPPAEAGPPEPVEAEAVAPAEAAPPEAEAAPTAPAKKKITLQAGAVETGQIVEHMARERAEERLQRELNARGFRGLWQRVSRRWMEEGYRLRYIALERQNIRQVVGGGQAQQGTAERVSREGVSAEQQAILERFLADYQGLLATGEAKREEAAFNDQLKGLVSRFVGGQISEAELETERNNLLNNLRQNAPDLFEREGLIADNILERARELKTQVDHAGGIANVDLDIRLTLGRARAGTRTEAELRTIDRLVNRLQTSPVLRWAATPVGVATVAGGAYSILNQFMRVGGGRVAALATSGASVLVASGFASGFAAARRGTELKRERAMHARQRAMSMDQDEATRKLWTPWREDTSRRERMDQMAYEMRSASSLLQDLQNSLDQVREGGQIAAGRINQDRLNEVIGRLADIDARTYLSDTRNIDLISFSNESQIETERKDLMLGFAKSREELRNFLAANTQGLPRDLQRELEVRAANRLDELLRGTGGINERDQMFATFRRGEMVRAAVTAAAVGVGVGVAVQEGIAYFSDNQQGWVEGMIKGRKASESGTVRLSSLEALRAHMSGDLPKPSSAGIHEVLADGIKIKIPDGTSILQEGGHEFLVDGKGDRITEIVRTQDGALSPQTAKDLADHGFRVEDHVTSGPAKVSAMEYFKDELGTHKRVDWHDEPGKRYSEFFKKLIEFEGKQQMLYMEKDASGQVYVNVDKIVQNIYQNLDEKFKDFGTNPDGSFDSKLTHLRDELTKWRVDGSLKDHLQVAIIPTEEANKKGLCMLVEGAGAGNKLALPKEVSDLFKTPESLKYLHHPVKYIEFRVNGHVIATTVGENMADITLPAGLHTPDIIPPVHEWEFVPPPHLPFAGRRPLEPTRPRSERPSYPYPEYPAYQYREAEYYETLRRDMSPRLRNNPDVELDPTVETSWYFQDQEKRYPGYVQQLEQQSSQEPEPMGKETDAVIALAVAGHEEHKNIYRTLETYAAQRKHDGTSIWAGEKSPCEILLYVNWPAGTSPDKTLGEIERFKERHPLIPVRVYKEEITNEKVELGFYKKKAFDLGLLRHKHRKVEGDILIIANDADMTSSSPTYLEDVRKFMNSQEGRKYDILRGRHDLDAEVYEKNPSFHSAMRFWEFMEAAVRRKEKVVGAQGRNTVMRGSFYAAIGGNRTRGFWADIEFDSLLAAARRDKRKMAYLNRAWVMVDPRRELDKFKSGELLAYTWSDFNERKGIRGGGKRKNEAPERIDVVKLAKLPESDRIVERFKKSLQEEIQAIVDVFGPYVGVKRYTEVRENLIRKAAEHLGVKVNIVPEGKRFKITVLDTAKLRERLREYKLRSLKRIKINKHPLKG